jgi:hypothetical protein
MQGTHQGATHGGGGVLSTASDLQLACSNFSHLAQSAADLQNLSAQLQRMRESWAFSVAKLQNLHPHDSFSIPENGKQALR